MPGNDRSHLPPTTKSSSNRAGPAAVSTASVASSAANSVRPSLQNAVLCPSEAEVEVVLKHEHVVSHSLERQRLLVALKEMDDANSQHHVATFSKIFKPGESLEETMEKEVELQ